MYGGTNRGGARSHRVIGILTILGCLLVAACVGQPSVSAPSSEDEAARVVDRLATGITLDRYIDILGRRPDVSRPAGSFREVLWVNDVYAVQAVIGDAGVLGYSVTTRSDRFRPPIDILGSAQLGTTPIGEAFGLTSTTTLVSSLEPTAGGVFWYSEALQTSGGTSDRAIVLTVSDAGFYGSESPVVDLIGLTTDPDPNAGLGPFSTVHVGDPRVSGIRGLVASTYSIIGPTLSLGELPLDFRFGPTVDDIEAVR